VNSRLRVGAAALGLAFVLAIALGATGVLTPKSQRTAAGASTTLTIITGPVFVKHLTGDFGPADDGSILGPGDTVKTASGSRAVLTYFEGSTVEIEPDSELTIDTAHANPDGSTVIVMQQDLGTTWHVVTHLVQGGSKYEVHTTAATASVRGTAFTVGVAPDGTTTETTTEGAVANSDSNGASTVVTPPGLQTTTKKGEKPADPVPAPEPERKVTVTVGDQNSLVVDTLGRANGIKDGKKILQTPGAQLEIVDGHLVITLPNIPDGTLSTHFLGTSGDTDVTAKVEDKGNAAVEVKDNVKSGTNAGVDIKKGTGENKPSIEKKTDKKDLPSPKVGEVPPVPAEEPKKADDANANKNDNGKDNGSSGNTNNNGNSNTTGTTTTTGGSTNTDNSQKDDKKTAPSTGGFVPPINLPPALGPTTPSDNNQKKDEPKKDDKKTGDSGAGTTTGTSGGGSSGGGTSGGGASGGGSSGGGGSGSGGGSAGGGSGSGGSGGSSGGGTSGGGSGGSGGGNAGSGGNGGGKPDITAPKEILKNIAPPPKDTKETKETKETKDKK
jgi:hypothetical protein